MTPAPSPALAPQEPASEPAATPPVSAARRIGQVAQGAALGVLLVLALVEVLLIIGDIAPFRYQGF